MTNNHKRSSLKQHKPSTPQFQKAEGLLAPLLWSREAESEGQTLTWRWSLRLCTEFSSPQSDAPRPAGCPLGPPLGPAPLWSSLAPPRSLPSASSQRGLCPWCSHVLRLSSLPAWSEIPPLLHAHRLFTSAASADSLLPCDVYIHKVHRWENGPLLGGTFYFNPHTMWYMTVNLRWIRESKCIKQNSIIMEKIKENIFYNPGGGRTFLSKLRNHKGKNRR